MILTSLFIFQLIMLMLVELEREAAARDNKCSGSYKNSQWISARVTSFAGNALDPISWRYFDVALVQGHT